MANEPTRPIGGTTMNNLVINKETTVKEALAGNGVLMVGRIPNKREVMAKMEANNAIVDISEDKVEIPEFLLRVQEERKLSERKLSETQRMENKKKAPAKKPSFRNAFISILKVL